MTMPVPRCQFALFRLLLLASAGLLGLAGLGVVGLVGTGSAEPPSLAIAQDLSSRQVTLFGVLATPGGDAVDARLKTMAAQLRKLMPGYSFELLEVPRSKRLATGESLVCENLKNFSAEITLLDPLDVNGKVQLRFSLGCNGELQMATVVSTPPNQLFFFDKPLENGSHLLVGIGAR
jgi:hypothetical protein